MHLFTNIITLQNEKTDFSLKSGFKKFCKSVITNQWCLYYFVYALQYNFIILFDRLSGTVS